MSKQTINIGASPNDGTGTPLRTSFDYTNQNFTELYTALGGGVGLPGATTQVIFNDGGTNLAGDAGLVYNKTTDTLTAGNATITGAATVGTTLGVTGASNLSGQLTVSTGANATPLNLTCSNAAGTTFNLSNTGGAGTHSFGGYNALIGGGNATDLLINSAGQTIIRAGSTNVATFTTAGNLTVDTGNVVMGTSGKGIDFSATASGSGTMTSELLNDYEEGTWVPSVGGTSTYTGQTGSYIKVGRLVTVSFDMAILLLGTGSTATISGLPFVVGSATSPKCEQCHGAAGYFGSLAVNVYSLSFYAGANGSTINSISMNTLGGTANVNPAIYGNGTRVQGTVTYIAA